MTVAEGIDIGQLVLQALTLIAGAIGGFVVGKKVTVQRMKIRDERTKAATPVALIGETRVELHGDPSPERAAELIAHIEGLDPRSLPR